MLGFFNRRLALGIESARFCVAELPIAIHQMLFDAAGHTFEDSLEDVLRDLVRASTEEYQGNVRAISALAYDRFIDRTLRDSTFKAIDLCRDFTVDVMLWLLFTTDSRVDGEMLYYGIARQTSHAISNRLSVDEERILSSLAPKPDGIAYWRLEILRQMSARGWEDRAGLEDYFRMARVLAAVNDEDRELGAAACCIIAERWDLPPGWGLTERSDSVDSSTRDLSPPPPPLD